MDAGTGQPTHIDSITVYSDEAFRYLMDQEVAIYESQQPEQHLHMIYKPEAEVLKILMTDSFSTVVLGRKLTEKERADLLKRTGLQTDERSFAQDAIAIVVHPDFAPDTLAYSQIASLISNTTGEYKLVFEGNGSGVLSYMFTQFAKGAKPSAFAVGSTEALIDYVQKDKKTIGFIPFARISDDEDTVSSHLLKKVKLLAVSRPDSMGTIRVSTASQSEIADGSYPFARPVTFISHSLEDKVGTGFVNFLYKEQSGRIVLKSGLVPAIMPQRVIHVNTDAVK